MNILQKLFIKSIIFCNQYKSSLSQEKKIQNKIMDSSHFGEIKRSLRSVNNCFKVPNLFLNRNQQLLTQNIEFIPKHIRRKIVQKQFLSCKDILDVQFVPHRPHVDIKTVKTAVIQQKRYENIIEQMEAKLNLREKSLKIHNLSEKPSDIKQENIEQENYFEGSNLKNPLQLLKQEIPTQKSLKKAIDQ